jgi:hypothetical protein
MAAPLTLSNPCDVSEYLLARTGEAYQSGDFDLFATCFALPQRLDTFEGSTIITTTAQLHSLFHGMRGYFQRLGVTDLVRRCVAARFRDPDTIEATHETSLLAGSRLLRPTYPCFSVIRKAAVGWQVADAQYAVESSLVRMIDLTGAPRTALPSSLIGD